ncbi:hypothetical protein SPRG_06471 [Saprolegnia parasitica CBS 223.65]|uniref:Uncharacterized protein n=1 Tax=Saprolegnia parasitica (strain CBS 223.65) TaxID=695850 RepID=A0A067CHF3_SAPPC|nr:hypothetical protein SPRG_06471 [Saprolegnia parasitica CBS 223.65]KDO28615.1 hypothetical protein SPRG_06471 [Saprolegnia parasitica CBS 223.65]|eukprot:XP_012200678.1 hypothetical protein SPRG_06471 [Saprolegnia parasitica CBS 223.65]
MPATFRSVVLARPATASKVFEFQFGVYEDVRSAFRACDELVEFDANDGIYDCDASFPNAFAPTVAAWPQPLGDFLPSALALRDQARDDRLPLHIAVAEGFLDLAQRMVRCRPDLASEDAILLAILQDRLEMADVLLELRATVLELRQSVNLTKDADGRLSSLPACFLPDILARDDTRGVEAAIKYATCENLTLALDLFPWFVYPSLLDGIAGRGFLSLVRSLHERGLECSTNAMDDAASNGHLEVVRFLHFNRTEGCTVDALDGAILNGHLDVIRFLLEHRTEGASPNVLDAAAANGHLVVVQYLHSLGSYDCTVDAVNKAASAGHLEVVQFLLTNRNEGCSRDKVVEKALANGHLRTAEYLLSLGYPFPTTEICLEAQAFRKPAMTPWETYAMEKACAANNLPLVRFLHAHAATCCRPDALVEAFANEAMDVVRFLLAHCAADVSVDALESALRGGHLAIATQLLQRHPELRDDDLLAVASSSHLTEATRFLLAAGIGKPRECLVKIAGYRNHVSESKLLLSYCMDPIDHLDNIKFLLDLLALPSRRHYLLSLGCPFPTSTIALSEDALRKPEMIAILELLVAHDTPWSAD